MSNQETRSKRYDQIQREKKLRRKREQFKNKTPKEHYVHKSSVDIKDKIAEALDNLEL
jgi:hypothetical protein